MVIGIDSHKRTLAACAVDALGAQVASAEFANMATGHLELLAWARGLGTVSRFGIEGSGGYGCGLAQFLFAEGECAVEVPSRLVGRERGRLRRREKSDTLDALAIAR